MYIDIIKYVGENQYKITDRFRCTNEFYPHITNLSTTVKEYRDGISYELKSINIKYLKFKYQMYRYETLKKLSIFLKDKDDSLIIDVSDEFR